MPNPPAAPNFMGAAQQQGQANTAAAQQQARLNNPNFYGVGGSQTVQFGPDGTPTVTQSLSPEQQQLYNATMANRTGAANAASGLLSLGQFGGQFDLSGAPAMPGDYNATREQVINAMMSRANEDFGQREDQVNSDLIARGIRPGTAAYADAMTRIDRARNDALMQAQIAGGDAADQAMRGDLARRVQGVNEAAMGREIPFREYLGLLGAGDFEMPQFQNFAQNNQVAPAPVFGATTAQSNYDVDLWNAQQQQRNSEMNGLFGLGNNFLNSSVGGNLIDRLLSSIFK